MNEYQAESVREFLNVILRNKLMNVWIEPSDSVISDGWTVFFNFDNRKDHYIQSIAEMQTIDFWKKLLTNDNNHCIIEE